MAYKYSRPSTYGLDGRRAGKCVSLITGETVTRASLNAKKPAKGKKGKRKDK